MTPAEVTTHSEPPPTPSGNMKVQLRGGATTGAPFDSPSPDF